VSRKRGKQTSRCNERWSRNIGRCRAFLMEVEELMLAAEEAEYELLLEQEQTVK